MTSAESRAAELVKLVRELTKFGSLRLTDFQAGQYVIQALRAHAEEAVLKEREACAKIADVTQNWDFQVATAIRARTKYPTPGSSEGKP